MPLAKANASPLGTMSGVWPRFFQPSIRLASWRAGQRSLSMPAASITCFIRRNWSSVSRIVKPDLRPAISAWLAQDLDADRVERAEPRHALDLAADQVADALLHLARGLVGEGHREDLAAARAARRHDVGDARRQHARLAGAGASQHEQRPVERLDRLTLLGIEPFEIGRGGRRSQRARATRSSRAGTAARCPTRAVGARRRGTAQGSSPMCSAAIGLAAAEVWSILCHETSPYHGRVGRAGHGPASCTGLRRSQRIPTGGQSCGTAIPNPALGYAI